MKMSRQDFKKIIKECLVEILTEDFIEGVIERKLVESTQSTQQFNPNSRQSKGTTANLTEDISREFLNKFRDGQKTKKIKTDITNNPLINELLADTARTTLPQQLQEENRGMSLRGMSSGNSSSVTNDYVSVDDGDSQWAKVAFAPKKLPGR